MIKIEAMPSAPARRRLLSLLDTALRHENHFVSQHPGVLFQALWNLCWWYDAPAASGERVGAGEAPPGDLPEPRLSDLMEAWLRAKERQTPRTTWLRSLRPPPLGLGGALRARFTGHTDTATCVAYSADASQLASGADDGSLRIWDATSGAPICHIPLGEAGERTLITGVAFFPDGLRIASAQTTMTTYTLTPQWRASVRTWVAGSGAPLLCMETSGVGVTSIAVSPDGRSLAAGYGDGTVRQWNGDDGREERAFRAHAEAVSGVGYSPDGKLLFTGSADRTLGVWDSTSGEPLHNLRHDSAIVALAVAPRGPRVVTGTADGALCLWDYDSGNELARLRGDEKWISGVAWLAGGQAVVAGYNGRDERWDAETTFRVWDLSPSPQTFCVSESPLPITCIASSPRAPQVATGDSEGVVAIWDVDRSHRTTSPPLPRRAVEALDLTPEGNALIVRYQDSARDIYGLPDAAHLLSLADSPGVGALTVSRDRRWLATHGFDRTVRIWNLTEAREHRSFERQQLPGTLMFSGDGRRLLSLDHSFVDMGPWSGDSDYTVHVWHVETGQELARCRVPDDRSEPTAVLSEDGTLVAIRFHGGKLLVWNVETNSEIGLPSPAPVVDSVAFSPNARQIAAGCPEGVIRVWDVDRAKDLLTLRGGSAAVARIGFSSDGRVLGSASPGGLRVWDVATGRLLSEAPDAGPAAFQACLETRTAAGSAGGQDSVPAFGRGPEWELRPVEVPLDLPRDVVMRHLHLNSQANAAEVLADHGMELVQAGAIEPVAWFPVTLQHLVNLPDGRSWAGITASHLSVLRLEGA
jgi:WD40 repeat protein